MNANLNHSVCGTSETKWTAKMVEEYFLEVTSTLKKLPPVQQRGYFNSWPDIVYSPNEIIFQERKPMRLQATPEAISKMEKSFEWMAWITIEERKLIWKRATKMRWRSICYELGCDRITAWRKWNIALGKIARKLNLQPSK